MRSSPPSNQTHIIIAGQFPPPVTGFAFITQQIAELIAVQHRTQIIDLSPHAKRGGIGYHLRRLMRTLTGIGPILRQAFFYKNRAFYTACEGDLGLIYTLILSTAARMMRTPIFIHHHSFGYIDRYAHLMGALTKVAGPRATHIFLCQIMADAFTKHYPQACLTTVISNSAFVKPDDRPVKPPQTPHVLGLLSNLNNAKGLGLFLELLHEARQKNLPVIGILAGPPDGEAERAAIEAAQASLGPSLDYRGPVYGPAKDAFFRAIDIFVFPTRYANEAQPTVIYEALAHGIPVLSYDRGCILSQIGHCGAVQRRDGDFVPFALEWLTNRLSISGALAQLKLDALTSFREDHALSRHAVAALFNKTAS